MEEGRETHSSILAWRIPMDRGAWKATVHEVAKTPLPVLIHVLRGWTPELVVFILKAFRDHIISVGGREDAGLAERVSPVL